MTANIILTTGLYDLIKDQIRRKKVSKEEEDILTIELKEASQVLRRELPKDVVSVNRRVTYKNHSNQKEKTITFVSPKKSKPSLNKISILSTEGLAMIGYQTGKVIDWPSKNGNLKFEILKVEEAEEK